MFRRLTSLCDLGNTVCICCRAKRDIESCLETKK